MKNYFFIVFFTICIACSNNETTVSNDITEEESTELVGENVKEITIDSVTPPPFPKVNKDLNDVALLVAGIEVDSNSKNYQFTQSSNWKKYSSMLDQTWAKIQENRLKKMQEWQMQELPDSITQKRVGIYPFSGPDFLTFYTFFGDAPSYYMFGLEPLGNVPNLKLMSEDSISLYY